MIIPMPPALEAQSLNHWTARKVPIIYSKYSHVYMLISVFETWKGFRNYGQSCQFCLDAPPLVCIYSSFLSYPADIPCSSEYKLRRSCSKGMSYQLTSAAFFDLLSQSHMAQCANCCCSSLPAHTHTHTHTHTHAHTHTHTHTHAAHHLSPCGKIRKILSIVMKTNTECVQSSTVSPEHFFHINSAPSP